ncbi:MAG: L-2-amino-thiazoline-4-carboxylic acid hydrolase [Desulfobacterales bacterium]
MDPNSRGDFPDTLTQQIGVLTRREVEARLLIPLIDALGAAFGKEAVLQVLHATIIQIARQQGAELSVAIGGSELSHFQAALEFWNQNDALKLEILRCEGEHLDFNVVRCRYAEMYQALGISELGKTLSCNRDFALIEGFNPQARLRRTQTLMEGARHCDFRYRFPAD